MTTPLYDYQEKAVQAMIKARGGILEGACGCGKTQIGIEIAHRIGQPFLWLTHTKDLLNQSLKRFKALYPDMDIGTITDGKVKMGRDGTIATIQTLVGIDPLIYKREFNVVIVDECHKVSGSPTMLKMFLKVIKQISARFKYGLTATAYRGDSLIKSMYGELGMSLNGTFEPTYTIDKSQTKTLTARLEQVYLNTPSSYEYLRDDGEFDYTKLIDYLSTNSERNQAIIDNVEKIAQTGRKQLILCSRIDQCELIHNKLKEDGYNSALLVGKVSDKKRKAILGGTNWDIIVATYSLAKEGLDLPILDTLHLAMIFKDKSQAVQCVGRIERIHPDKQEPVVYDYVDRNIPYCLGAAKKRKGYINGRH